jgi:hypothetical protein
LHKLRVGEPTQFGERPHAPYYGAADTTPLFLVLLDEMERWTGDRTGARDGTHVRPALDWIDRYGDRDGDGYVEYARRNTETGLENQCCKNSWNSILFADGSLAKLPRATSEIQGFVYDAKACDEMTPYQRPLSDALRGARPCSPARMTSKPRGALSIRSCTPRHRSTSTSRAHGDPRPLTC